MGPQVFEKQYSEKMGVNTIAVEDTPSGFNGSSTILLEQQFTDDLPAVKPPAVLTLRPTDISVFTETFIRAFDVVGSIIMLLLAAPLMLFIAVIIKVSSAGPALYKQLRVGKDGKIFQLYKFRTMVDGAEKDTGPVWAAKDDERVTPLGGILRCSRLDELPQLFNVLQGDMSLVGPRPERPHFVRQHRALQGVRLMVKPGITGLAQIRAFYDLKPEHKLRYDFLYIQKRTFLLNLYILLMTIPVVLFRKGW